jgi:hypothetical protein
MTNKPYPAVSKDFGDSFGMSPSKEKLDYDNPDVQDQILKDHIARFKEPTMPHTIEKLNRTDILEQALANATPKPSRSTHLKLLSEHEWKLIHEARKNGSKAGLAQLFLSMQRSYQDNDEAFFATYAQFYNAYRQAAKLYELAPIKPRKSKSE